MSAAFDLMTLSVRASAAVRRGRFVGFNGAEAAATGQKCLGVARTAAAIGQDVALVVSGTVMVEAGSAIAIGATVATDNQGRAVTASGLVVQAGGVAMTSVGANGNVLTGADSPIFAMGDALTAATAAGQFIEVLLRR